MRRVTFDTNVYIAALTSKRALLSLLTMAKAGVFALQVSDDILDEVEEVLVRDFFWTKSSTYAARLLLLNASHLVTPHVELNVVERDPDDNRILECSQASGSDLIVTSDKDLLSLRTYAGADIIKPGVFLTMMAVKNLSGRSLERS